jgi:hypothetical protein
MISFIDVPAVPVGLGVSVVFGVLSVEVALFGALFAATAVFSLGAAPDCVFAAITSGLSKKTS